MVSSLGSYQEEISLLEEAVEGLRGEEGRLGLSNAQLAEKGRLLAQHQQTLHRGNIALLQQLAETQQEHQDVGRWLGQAARGGSLARDYEQWRRLLG